jgi:hypothetical protein
VVVFSDRIFKLSFKKTANHKFRQYRVRYNALILLYKRRERERERERWHVNTVQNKEICLFVILKTQSTLYCGHVTANS